MRNQILQALLKSPHKKGDALPSVRSLMEAFMAGSATVQSALRKLEADKKIYTIRGKGCFWGSTPIQVKVPKAKETPFDKLDRLFENDWEHGFFKINAPLPLLKELTERYHVSHPILHKFFQHKVDIGVLQQIGRRYFFAQDTNKRNNNIRQSKLSEIIFVTRCNSWGGFNAESERELDFLRLVYHTAGASKYKLILLGINEMSGNLIDRSGKIVQLQDYPNAVGAILSTLLIQKPLHLLQIFSAVKYPVAVWWEHPLKAIPKFFLNKIHWAFFNSTFGELPGMELGKYLISHNIHHVVYYSPYHNSSWSKDRLLGLKKAGLQVESRTDDEFASPWDYKQIAREHVAKHSVETYARKLQKNKMKKWAIPPQKQKKDEWWVCVNDEVAGIFIEMAEEGSCVLPGNEIEPNIIAFDNSAESYLLRLKSYDFNTNVLVEQMFYYISNPEFGKNKVHQICGEVIEK